MNMKQVWGAAGGFFFAFIVLTLTNKPQLTPKHAAAGAVPSAAYAGNSPSDHPAGATAGESLFGFCLPGQGASSLGSADTDALLSQMASHGARWIAISPALFQQDGFSNDVSVDAAQTPDDASLAHAIATCRSLGLHVLLRPVVVAKDGTQRQRFTPSDPQAWFRSYALAVTPWVDLAQREGVDVFCLGANYAQLEQSQPWGELASQVRERFKGRLTYGASLLSESGNGGYQAAPFWKDLDYVGLEAALPEGAGGNEADLAEVWRDQARQLDTWVGAQQPGKQVVFTSVGYSPSSTVDPEASHRAFQSIMSGQTWLAAANWYQYDDRQSEAGRADGTQSSAPSELQVR